MPETPVHTYLYAHAFITVYQQATPTGTSD
jgi:hypothetical protein